MNVASRFRLLAPAIVLVALSACGGETPAREPELRARVGAELAARADAVAVSLDSGDTCDARERAQALQRDVATAIDSGRVPAELQRELRRTSARLVAQIECVVAEPPADEGDQGDEGDEGDEGGDAEGDGGGDGASCEALESRKAEIDAEKEELKEQIEDEKERKEREKELEEEKKAIDEELKACEEGE